MKRSGKILIGVVLLSAVASCHDDKKDWVYGDENGKTHDTSINNNHYRYYHGGWYPIYMGRINPYRYEPASYDQINRPGYAPEHGLRSGGFGSSAGEHGAGEGGHGGAGE